jgi:GNAT superfamily N-acetyltransferase
MQRAYVVRHYREGDRPAIQALEQRVQPYRLEDMAEVEAMHRRAARARASGDGWIAHQPEPDTTADIPLWYAGFWVAEQGGTVVGMVGVRTDFLPGVAPPRHDWHERDDIAELRRLRVAPEARRQGIGAALTNAVIDWCRANGRTTLYLHTTSPQAPARALYEALGFENIGHVLTGEWEYVWYARPTQMSGAAPQTHRPTQRPLH